MKVIDNEVTCFIDVDDSILGWVDPESPGPGKIEMDLYGDKKYLYPHVSHVELVKSYYKRGFFVVVWSGNGWAWAEQAVKKLGLEDYVDQVMTKPMKYVDNEDVSEWFPKRIFLPWKK